VENIKALFEGELKEARNLLDELSKDKAQLQLESNSLKEENNALKSR